MIMQVGVILSRCGLAIGMLLACTSLAVADDAVSRPRLEGYSSYGEFLQAMRVWRLQVQGAAQAAVTVTIPGKGLTSLQELPEDSPEMNALLLDEHSPPPLVVNGPEDLDQAVEQASHFIHPAYTAARRYHRSTYQSFPLHQAETVLLQEETVDAAFGDDAQTEREQITDSLAASVVGAGLGDEDGTTPVQPATGQWLPMTPVLSVGVSAGAQVSLDVLQR